MMQAIDNSIFWKEKADPTNKETQLYDAVLHSLATCEEVTKSEQYTNDMDVSLIEEGVKQSLKWLREYGFEVSSRVSRSDGVTRIALDIDGKRMEVAA